MANADMIYILNKYDQVIGGLSNDLPNACPFWDDLHHEQLENGYEVFELKIPIYHPSGTPDLIEEERKLMIRDLDGGRRLFRIKKITDNTIAEEKIIFAESESIELFNDPVRPLTISGSPNEIMNAVLNPSRWEPGVIETATTNTLTIEEYSSVLAAVHAAADLFDLEIRFRIEYDGAAITGRFVDLLQRKGNPSGTFFNYSQDIQGLTRTKDSTELATALIGVGKSDESENPTTFESITWSTAAGNPVDKPLGQDWIGDPSALDQFGVDGRHIFRVFTLSDETDPARLLAATWDELQRRIKGAVEYEVELILLEKLAGYEHKAVRIGDTITIKDTTFATPLVLEARVLEIKRSMTDPTKDEVVLGEYRERELTESEMIRRLQLELSRKSAAWEQGGGIEVVESPTPPTDPVDGLYWLDTSKVPNIWKRFDLVTGSWIPATPDRADQLIYQDGRTVEALKPAQAGADVTGTNTSQDTKNVAGTDAQTVSSGAAEGSEAKQKIETDVGTGTIETTAGSSQKAAPGQAANDKIQSEVGTGTIETTAGALAKAGPVSTTPPVNPGHGDKWVDISDPGVEVWKRFNSSTGLWEEIGRASFDQMTGSVVQGQIGIGAVGNQQLADLAVDLAKIADNSVNVYKIVNNSITTDKISDGAVSTTDMADNSVNVNKIVNNAITNAKMADGSIGNPELINLAVSTAKVQLDAITNDLMALNSIGVNEIVDLAISNAKIQTDAITNAKMANGSVNVAELVDGAVTNVKVATDAITNVKMANGAVGVNEIIDAAISTAKIQLDAVTNDLMALNSIGSDQVIAESLTGSHLAIDTITGNKITSATIGAYHIIADTITSSKIAARQISAYHIVSDSITASQIAANAITASELAADSVTSGHIVANTILATDIAALTITASQIAANTIGAGQIVANSIGAGQIAADSITASQIAANAITASELATDSVTSAKILAGTIVAADIASATITATQIAGSTITGTKIAARTISAGHIVANSITANEIAANTITASKIAAGTITTDLIAATGLSANVIKGGQISADVLFAGSLVGATGSFSGSLSGATGTFAGTVTSSELIVDYPTGARLKMRMPPGMDGYGNVYDEDLFVVIETYQTAATGSVLSIAEEWFDIAADNWIKRAFGTVEINANMLRVGTENDMGSLFANRIQAGAEGVRSEGDIELNVYGALTVKGNGPVVEHTSAGHVAVNAVGGNLYIGNGATSGVYIYPKVQTTLKLDFDLNMDYGQSINFGTYDVLRNNGSDTIVNATYGDLYLGHQYTSKIRFQVPAGSNLDMADFVITTSGRGWIAPSLLNGASNFGSGYETAGYYKDALGFVRIKGLIRPASSTGSVLFTLPVGYRPSGRRMFACYASTGTAVRVDVDASGNVWQMGGSTATSGYLSLEGIVFNT